MRKKCQKIGEDNLDIYKKKFTEVLVKRIDCIIFIVIKSRRDTKRSEVGMKRNIIIFETLIFNHIH